MPKFRVRYDCFRCPGFRVKTADAMITHFRIKHGIKPETFSAEKRKAFYDYFKLTDDEYTRDTDEEREDGPTGSEMDTTHPQGDHDPYNLSALEVTESTLDIAGNNGEEILSTDIKIPEEGYGPYFCPYCGKGVGYYYPALKQHFTTLNKCCKRRKYYTCQDCETGFPFSRKLKYHQNKYGGKCAEVQKQRQEEREHKRRELEANSLQEAVEVALTESTPNLAADIKIPEEGTGPYFCPYCGKGVGYNYSNLKIHFTVYNKSCERQKYYSCDCCKTDFLTKYELKYHGRKFNGKCAKIQKRRSYKNREMETTHLQEAVEVTESTLDIAGNNGDEILSTDIKIPEEGYGPYFCPYCGKGVGYDHSALNRHFTVYNKSCVRQEYYSCACCKTDFLTPYELKYHGRKFNDNCAEIQKQRQEEREHKNKEMETSSLQEAVEVTESTTDMAGNTNEEILPTYIKIPEEGTGGPYFCPYCGKGVGYYYPALKWHFSTYNKSCKRRKYYTCQDCETDFPVSRALIYHQNKYGAKCAEVQKQKQEEREHKRRKLEVSSLQEDHDPCNLSPSVELTESTTDMAGNTNEDILSTDINIPEEGTGGPYFCPYCGKGVGYYYPALKWHFAKYNKSCQNERRKYTCLVCKTDFVTTYLLRYHERNFKGKCAEIQKLSYPNRFKPRH